MIGFKVTTVINGILHMGELYLVFELLKEESVTNVLGNLSR